MPEPNDSCRPSPIQRRSPQTRTIPRGSVHPSPRAGFVPALRGPATAGNRSFGAVSGRFVSPGVGRRGARPRSSERSGGDPASLLQSGGLYPSGRTMSTRGPGIPGKDPPRTPSWFRWILCIPENRAGFARNEHGRRLSRFLISLLDVWMQKKRSLIRTKSRPSTGTRWPEDFPARGRACKAPEDTGPGGAKDGGLNGHRRSFRLEPMRR